MTFPEFKLVDAPSAVATVLFDFNDITATPFRQVNGDGFTIGTPELEGDVDAIDPLYGERTVSFTCNLRGTKAQVAATLSQMSRRIMAPGRGWLRVQLTPTSRLLFFRTYRPEPGDLSFDMVQSASDTKRESWDVQVTLPCEPFAYGEVVTQTAKTVSQDPTSTGNPTYFTLDAIAGDVPAPLRYRIVNSVPIGGRSRLQITHHASMAVTPPVQIPLGSSDAQGGTSDVTVVTDANHAGGSYRKVAFGTGNPSNIFISTAVRPGRYKAVLRVAVSDATTTVAVRIGQSLGSGDVVYQPAVRTSAAVGTGNATWLDLGNLQLPFRRPQAASDLPASSGISAILDFVRTAGSGTIAVDHLILMPIERPDTQTSSTVTVEDANQWLNTTNRALIVDGLTTDTWCIVPSTGALLDNAPAVRGVFPSGAPGADNTCVVLFSASPTAPADNITRNLTVTVSYLPRFLYIGDS